MAPVGGITRRRFIALGAAAGFGAACGGLAGLGARPTPGGTLRIAIGVEPDSLDPAGQTTTLVMNVLDHMVEPLTRIDEEGKAQPLLAERWESSADGRTHTFFLRKGVTFHDGAPLDASAVKASFDRWLDPGLRVPQRALLEALIERIEAVDGGTVRFGLKIPFIQFPAAMGFTGLGIVSPSTAQRYRTTYNEEPVGTGAYVFKERRKGESVTMTRNENYWGKRPWYDTVVVRIVPEAATRESLLLAGQVDLIVLPPMADLPALQRNGAVKVIAGASDRTMFLAFNHTRAPFKDKRVRQALNLAIDRDAIIKNVLFGMGQKMDAPMAPSLFGYCKIGGYDYDPDKAKRLLREAGQEKLSVKLAYPTGRFVQDAEAGQAIAGNLRDLGIAVETQTSDWPTYLATVVVPPEKSTVDLHLLGLAPSITDAAIQFEQFLGRSRWPPKGLASSYYENAQVTQLAGKAMTELDPASRAKLYCDASKIVWDDAPWAFLWVQQFPIVHSAKITGVTSTPDEKFYSLYAEPA